MVCSFLLQTLPVFSGLRKFLSAVYPELQPGSRTAAQLTTKLPFIWSHDADQAFTKLKELFTSTPVLIHPDPKKPLDGEPECCDSTYASTSTIKLQPSTPSFSHVVSPLWRGITTWETESPLLSNWDPGTGPANRLYVPTADC